jgi:hypothetical protein
MCESNSARPLITPRSIASISAATISGSRNMARAVLPPDFAKFWLWQHTADGFIGAGQVR